MALSDEDREAIQYVRGYLEGRTPLPKVFLWERVLKLAGEEPPEPADGTWWLDIEEDQLWIRDDKAAYDHSDLGRWWCTGTGEKFSWIQMCGMRLRLVELVRKDSTGVVVDEMYGAAEALHVKLHGSAPGTLFTCTSPECRFARDAALRHGLIASRWS
jgi:hypothetical protein